MMTLHISVKGTEITVQAGACLTAGLVGVPYEVEYDPSWDSLSKMVVFSNGTMTRNAVNGVVPWEVLAQPMQQLRVGIVGRREDGTIVIPTIWANAGIIAASASESDDPTLDPENPAWAQSAAIAQRALRTVQNLEQRADSGEFKGEKGDPGPAGPQGSTGMTGKSGPAGKSAYQIAQSNGYTGTEADFGVGLTQAAQIFEKDVSGWIPVVEMDGEQEPWEKGFCWNSAGEKITTQSTKDYFASTKFRIQPNCSYELIGLSGEMYLYDAAGRNGIKIVSLNPAETIRFRTNADRRYGAISTKITNNWPPQRMKLTRTSISEAEYEALPAKAQQLKPLFDKKVICFGDGLFGMHLGETAAPAYAARFSGAVAYNVGFGGCQMSVHKLVGYSAFSMWALAKAAASGDWSVQDNAAKFGAASFPEQLKLLKSIDFSKAYAAVIHYGTNDFMANAPLDAANKQDCSTICGALRYSIHQLQTAFPNLQIYVSLPVYRYWMEGNRTVFAEEKANANGIRLADVCSALADVARAYNCPVIDGYHGLNINRVNASRFLEDGTHHNQYGRERFGTFIGQCLTAGGCHS